MKKWYLIDDCLASKGQVFESVLDCNTQKKAFDLAVREWEALSVHDQQDRDDFYIGFADIDDNGCVDYNSMTDIISIKKGEKPVKKHDETVSYAVHQTTVTRIDVIEASENYTAEDYIRDCEEGCDPSFVEKLHTGKISLVKLRPDANNLQVPLDVTAGDPDAE